jgi:hypothetical protein
MASGADRLQLRDDVWAVAIIINHFFYSIQLTNDFINPWKLFCVIGVFAIIHD